MHGELPVIIIVRGEDQWPKVPPGNQPRYCEERTACKAHRF